MKKESKTTLADKKPANTPTAQKAEEIKKPAQVNDLKKTSPTTPTSSSKTTASKLNTTNNTKVDPVKAKTKPSQIATSPELTTGSSKLTGSASKTTSSALKNSTASKSGETSPKQKGKSVKTSQSVITQDETMTQQANESSFVVIENPSEVISEPAIESSEAQKEQKEEKLQVPQPFQEQKVQLRKESSNQPTDTVGTFVEEQAKVEEQQEVDERITEEKGNHLQIEELEPNSKIMEDQSPSKLSEEINCEPEYQFDTRQYRQSMSSEDNELLEIKPTFVDTTIEVSLKEQEIVQIKEKIQEKVDERLQEEAEVKVQEKVVVEAVQEPIQTIPLFEEKIEQNVPQQSQVVGQPLEQPKQIIEQTKPDPFAQKPNDHSPNIAIEEQRIEVPVYKQQYPAKQSENATATHLMISQQILKNHEIIQDQIKVIKPLPLEDEQVPSRYTVLKKQREIEEQFRKKREEAERNREKEVEREREEFARRKSELSSKSNASKKEEKVEETKPKEKKKPKPTIKEQPKPEVLPAKKPKSQNQTHYSKNQRISRSIDNQASLKQSLITIAEQKDRNGSKQCCIIM